MTSLISFGANYLFVAPLIIAIYIWAGANPHTRYLVWIRALIIALVAAGLVYLLNNQIPETRPYLFNHTAALINNPPTDNSFPSDHTTLSFAAAFLVLPFSLPLGILSVLLAALVGMSRVAAGVHWPIDIVTGIAIAAIANFLAYILFPGERKPAKDKEKDS